VRDLLRNFGDLERWTNRVMQGTAYPRDLIGIREALRLAPKVEERLGIWELGSQGDKETRRQGEGEKEGLRGDANLQSPISNLSISQSLNLPLCPEVLALLESALVDEPPASLATPGLIRSGSTPSWTA
jgi:DNA mismatch repair ATPase MutS